MVARSLTRSLITAVVTTLVGCSEPVKAPTLKPEQISMARMSPAGAEIETTLEAVNPNKAQLSATSIQTKTTLGGRSEVARVVIQATLVLPANQTAKLKLPIRVEWVDAAGLAALAATKQPAQYVVEGTVDFSDGRETIKAPFQVSGVMSASELAQAAGAPTSSPASAAASGATPPPAAPRK